MPSSTNLFVGLDPSGGRKPFTYAALDQSGRLVALKNGEMEDALAFLAGQQSALVAVNAPRRPNAGLVRQDKREQNLPPLGIAGRSLDMRLAEHQLRERGINIAMTPARREFCAHWVVSGFDFYECIEATGFLPYPTDSAAYQWLETNPHATFCALLGQLPLSRAAIEGRQQRQLALYEQGLGIRDPMEFFEEITRHKLLKGMLPLEQIYLAEELDAIAAAYVAYLCQSHPERISKVGDAQEGQIVLPISELKAKY